MARVACVVTNEGRGAFGLSKDAIDAICELKGVPSFRPDTIARHDPHLVETVRRLGDGANGPSALLTISELPDGINWYRVGDYDGVESVEVKRGWMSAEGGEVVINVSRGGFRVSDAGFKRYRELGGAATSAERIPRHEPALLQTVREMGAAASFLGARLEIQVLDGDEYWVGEHDGEEWVETSTDGNWVLVQ